YSEVIGLQDFSKGAFIGMILLFPAIVTFLIDLRKSDGESGSFSTKPVNVEKNKVRDTVLFIFVFIIIAFIVILMSSFVFMTFMKKYPYDISLTFEHIKSVAQKDIFEYFGNSLLISALVALIGTVIGYVTAYVSARTNNNLTTRILHLTSISSLAIPGIVLGLGYVIAFNKSFLYGTIIILVFVNIIHFFSSPYMMAHNAMKKLNSNYEDVGKTLGVGRFRILRDVFIPSTIDTITEMFVYFFVNSMITISAVAFLYTTKTMPVSMMINQFESNMAFESAAFVSLVILVTNIAAKIIFGIIQKIIKKVRLNSAC
ncbi:MAG: ABC transporter permease subunit, partial [Oscillospiraceae bacterium]